MGRALTSHLYCRLPVELVFQVVSWLQPPELALWRWVSIHYRRDLDGPGKLWRSAFELVPGLPPCPVDLTPLRYAALVFGSDCNYCKNRRIKRRYELHLRLCKDCSQGLGYASIEHVYLVPSIPNGKYAGKVSTVEYAEFKEELASKEGSDLVEFLNYRKDRRQRVLEHANIMYTWKRRNSNAHRDERFLMQEQRLQGVFRYMNEEGYCDTVIRLFEPQLRSISSSCRSAVVSAASWKKKRDRIVGPLRACYDAVLRGTYVQDGAKKREGLGMVLRSFCTARSLPRFPNFNDQYDLAWFPCIPALLDDGLSLPDFQRVLSDGNTQACLFSHFYSWLFSTVEFALLSLLPQHLDALLPQHIDIVTPVAALPVVFEEDVVRALQLATSVFRFDKIMGALAPPPYFPMVSRYPANRWTFDSTTSHSVEQALRSCELGPDTSWADMVNYDFRFACHTCLLDPCATGPVIMNWWNMVRHLQEAHPHGVADCCRVSRAMEAVARVLSPHVEPSLFRCCSCYIMNGADTNAYFKTADEAQRHANSLHTILPNGEAFERVSVPYDEYSIGFESVAIVGAELLSDFPRHLVGTKMPHTGTTRIYVQEFLDRVPGLSLFDKSP